MQKKEKMPDPNQPTAGMGREHVYLSSHKPPLDKGNALILKASWTPDG